MSAPETCHFQPGQLVECIDDRWGRKDGLPMTGIQPSKGCVYTVSDVEEDDGRFFLVLVGMGEDASFCSRQFRPVQTPSIDCFRQLLAPLPERELA